MATDIPERPDMQQIAQDVVVPTTVFNEGEEEKRFQANIMMTVDATRKMFRLLTDHTELFK